ncbi:MAG: hypothetical protein AAFU79_09940, partial [Myxococcota bacterium]
MESIPNQRPVAESQTELRGAREADPGPATSALLRVEAADDRTLLAWSRRSLRRLGVERGRRGARISFSRSPQLGLALGNWT